MKNLARVVFIGLLLVNFLPGNFIISTPNSAYAQDQDDWKQEYADICAKTQDAMGLTVEELKGYIERCEKLQERIDKLSGPQADTERKVYTKRLKMCRELYVFALEYKEHKQQQ